MLFLQERTVKSSWQSTRCPACSLAYNLIFCTAKHTDKNCWLITMSILLLCFHRKTSCFVDRDKLTILCNIRTGQGSWPITTLWQIPVYIGTFVHFLRYCTAIDASELIDEQSNQMSLILIIIYTTMFSVDNFISLLQLMPIDCKHHCTNLLKFNKVNCEIAKILALPSFHQAVCLF